MCLTVTPIKKTKAKRPRWTEPYDSSTIRYKVVCLFGKEYCSLYYGNRWLPLKWSTSNCERAPLQCPKDHKIHRGFHVYVNLEDAMNNFGGSLFHRVIVLKVSGFIASGYNNNHFDEKGEVWKKAMPIGEVRDAGPGFAAPTVLYFK